jgi:hypothetical protein
MSSTTEGSRTGPDGVQDPFHGGSADGDVWFEVHGRDATVTGTTSGVVHRRVDGANVVVREWPYTEVRSFRILDDPDGGAIVIDPRHGPLVSIPIAPESREEAYQAATVLGLLVARAERSGAASTSRPHSSKTRG